jgi:hypothetical protein
MPDWEDMLKTLSAEAAKADDHRPILDTIARIETLNSGLAEFWRNATGWAPESAACLLGKSRLDWQVSLSKSLRHWITEPADAIEDGDLILAWVNLGSLIEGTIKLFLSIYFEDYQADLDNLKNTQAWHKKENKLFDPDGLRLDVLIDYCEKSKLLPDDELEIVKLIQTRRNAVHAFKDRSIGSGSELHHAIRRYLNMLRSTNCKLPYPDGAFMPSEV